MKNLNPSPVGHIVIENHLQVDDNFVNVLNYLTDILKRYTNSKYEFKNNLQNDKLGLSVFVIVTPETSKPEFQQIINYVKDKYPNLNYNPQNGLISYTSQQQKQNTTTNKITDKEAAQRENMKNQLYGNVAQQLISKAFGESSDLYEEIKRFKELIK